MGSIGENIRIARKLKKLTQEDVAAKLGVSRSTYAEWEGDIEPKVTMLIKIADALEVNLIDLVAGVLDEKSGKSLKTDNKEKANYQQIFDAFIDELAKLNAQVFGEPESVYKKNFKKKTRL